MQINNSIHYNSDPYLLSNYQHKNEDKTGLQLGQADDVSVDISAARLEEKLYAKSVNAVPAATESTALSEQDSANKAGFNSSAQQAIASYTKVENSLSSQQFNQLQEIV